MVDFTNDGSEVLECSMNAGDAIERFRGMVMSKKCLCWQ